MSIVEGVDIKGQVLITGCYRTGSEFLTQLINSHPCISATFYTVNFMRFCFGKYGDIHEAKNWHMLIADFQEKLKVRFGREVHFDQIAAHLDLGNITYAALYQALVLAQHHYPGVKYWAEKTQLVWSKIPDFLHLFPQGKAIQIIRDPRSVLASFKAYTNAPHPRYLGAIFNRLGAMQSARRFQSELPADRYLLLRYEDLASQTDATMADVFSFIGVDPTPAIHQRDGWVDAHNQPWHANTTLGDPARFSTPRSINRWREDLQLAELFLCEMVNQPLMAHYGYEASGCTAPPETVAETLKAAMTDEQIASFFRNWAATGDGVECFPSDPFDPKTWEDVAIAERIASSAARSS